MTRTAVTALLVALLALAAAGRAAAAPHEQVFYLDALGAPHYQGERDALSNPIVKRLTDNAVEFFRSVAIEVCPKHVRMAPDLGEDPGVGPAGGRGWHCHAWVLTESVARANTLDEWWLWALCGALMHELLHTADIGHGLLMDTLQEDEINPYCTEQAKRIRIEARQSQRLRRAREASQTAAARQARQARLASSRKARRADRRHR